MTDEPQTLYLGPGRLYMRPLSEVDKRPDWQRVSAALQFAYAFDPISEGTSDRVVGVLWDAYTRHTFSWDVTMPPAVLRLLYGGRIRRDMWHPDMASKPHVPVKPSTRSRRRNR